MKTIIKITLFLILLISLSLIVRYKKNAVKLESFSPNSSVEINTQIIKDIITHINDLKLNSQGIDVVNLEKDVDRPFGKFVVRFNNYSIDRFVVNGKLYFEFRGFNANNNPYYVIETKNLVVKDNNKKFVVNGTQVLTYLKGFYSFSDLSDDIVSLRSNIQVKYDNLKLSIVDKDVNLKAYKPVYGFRTIVSDLGETIMTFSSDSYVSKYAK